MSKDTIVQMELGVAINVRHAFTCA